MTLKMKSKFIYVLLLLLLLTGCSVDKTPADFQNKPSYSQSASSDTGSSDSTNQTDKDKAKKTITLLTTSGVVTVKMFGPVFVNYDKQISEVGADGRKHVIEPSWLSRGNKIIVTGIRRDENFIAKKYSRTPFHLCELITGIDENGYITT